VLGGIAALIAVAIAVVGCGAGTSASVQSAGMKPAAAASATATSSAGIQMCGECGGLGAAKETTGEAMVLSGVQTVSIAIVDGYYVPNRITAKAGVATKVVFTGSAKGCVAKPKFGSLGKSGDLTGTGSTTIDLGVLAAGSYDFTCAMGANKGTIVFQ
jgi:plastocyanin